VLLAVNVGNTHTVLGLFRDTELAWHWRMTTDPSRTPDELALVIGGFLAQQGLSFSRQITGVVISSVVPACTTALRDMTGSYFHFPPVVVEPGVRTGMPVLTDSPREVGADRIVNALAGYSRFGGPCVVVDIGTAITYDAVSDRGEFLGGAISPGIQISATSLFSHTAKLPMVELVSPRSVIGKNTVEAIQAGLVFGTAAEVDGVVKRMREELGEGTTTVATGGLAGIVIPFIRSIDHHDPWLTLEGLRQVFERNVAER
jgi:type III pantothenate kinase